MRRMLFALTAALVSVAAGAAPPTPAADTYTYVTDYPVSFTRYLPCVAEPIDVEGVMHHVIHMSSNGNRVNMQQQWNPMGVSGIGQLSGDLYRSTGTEHIYMTMADLGAQMNLSRVFIFRFVGTGAAPTFYVKAVSHIIFNAKGEVTSSVSVFDLACE